ncbi:Pectinesterase, catalytic [Sesbania bispinosa]|nr:Pectinesterase, catalytic [Sesbania bispinosa]
MSKFHLELRLLWCDIYGTVDFIFGNAAVVFQNCNLFARNPPNKVNTITAQGRIDPNQNTGISIHSCRVTAASDLKPVQGSVKTYLGRPWQQYSRTVFMKTYLDSLINPAGWMEWSANFALSTLYYGEYMNTGPGSSTANRVNWSGYHVITSAFEASKFIVANLLLETRGYHPPVCPSPLLYKFYHLFVDLLIPNSFILLPTNISLNDVL